jgi:citrate synthase
MKNQNPWWETKIVKIEPNKIVLRGYRVEELIGNVSYAEMVYLMVMEELPHPEHGRLLEAVLVGGCDHGPKAPSVAAARMAASCGITFNSCIATGINVLGDIHGGAGEQAMNLFYEIRQEAEDSGEDLKKVAQEKCRNMRNNKQTIPGFGHRFHTRDPRAKRLFDLAREVQSKGLITGEYLIIAEAIKEELCYLIKRELAINIDGVSAAIQCELGLPSKIAKGLFSLSRGIGILAHAYEESQSGSRIKGPIPPNDNISYVYSGPEERDFEKLLFE